MGKSLTKKIIDHSDTGGFSFSFLCDRCGREWTSERYPFPCGDVPGIEIENDGAKRLLWAEEHRIAFERANLEAQFRFNRCRECGKWVCEECFFLSELEDSDVCLDCRQRDGPETKPGGEK